MISPRVRTFGLAMLLGAGAAHVLWSLAMGTVLASSYSHRIPDLRRWPDDIELPRIAEMTSTFLAHAVPASAAPTATLFFGSSLTYGYPWQEELTATSRYAALRPQEHVVNVGVLGATLQLLDAATLCGANNAGVSANIVVVELPVFNSINYLKRTFGRTGPPAECDETIGPVSPWLFALRHPLAAGWPPYIWDDKAFPRRDHDVLTRTFFGYFVSPEIYKRVEPSARRDLTAALTRAKTIGRQVYAFPSPVLVSGVSMAWADEKAVEMQLAAALAACRDVSGVRCLDPGVFYRRRDLYWNLTHFNQRGNQEFANWLVANIAPPDGQ
jgi:hypothetical protein